jgi:hypothetical protein
MINELERKNSATNVDQIPDRHWQDKYIQVEFEARARKSSEKSLGSSKTIIHVAVDIMCLEGRTLLIRCRRQTCWVEVKQSKDFVTICLYP